MKFFKNLKESILGSIKEDLNSALGGKQALFNSKIAGALDDLIAMKTGINISNIPSKITEEAALASERRRKLVKNIDEMQQFYNCAPSKRTLLRFPTSNDRFVDNWIVFRTLPRSIDGDHMRGKTFESDGEHGINVHESTYTNKPSTGQASRNNGKERYKFTADQRECSIALYFPNNVKDTIQVDYETKEVGLGDAVLNEIFSFDGGGMGAMDALSEGLTSMQQSMIAMTALQKGVAAGNPKFLNYQGVGMREHQYTFTLNPYNEQDAQEITAIIHWFKLMSLPMSSNKNPRIMILPAEWSINFMGPILGQIEHPQNCFLSTVDVDYSGGKDMSFIEAANYMNAEERKAAAKAKQEAQRAGTELDDSAEEFVKHYPNGITLSLTFKEILNIDRLRYVGKVAAAAKGANQDVLSELENFEYGRGDDIGTGTQTTETGDRVGD
tara:strand:+ start:339 stop:1661 length:1323 start_codon:yes stop_codon:yes gene_type:complete